MAGHEVLGGGRDLPQPGERGVDGRGVAVGSPLLDLLDVLVLDLGVDRHDAAALRDRGQRRRLRSR